MHTRQIKEINGTLAAQENLISEHQKTACVRHNLLGERVLKMEDQQIYFDMIA